MLRVSMLVGTIALLLLAACIQVAPTPAPLATPMPVSPITREQAIQIALMRVAMSAPEATAVENPRNPVARLMTVRGYWELKGDGYVLPDPDALLWVVQFEGESYTAGIAAEPRRKFSYATVVLDAESGRPIAESRTFAPLFPA